MSSVFNNQKWNRTLKRAHIYMCVCIYVYIKLNHFAVYLKHNIVNQLQFVLIAAIGMVKKKKRVLGLPWWSSD